MTLSSDRQTDPGVEQIDAILPQTQCRQCGYSGCRPYAQALATGQADINRCPPGGEAGIHRLAALTGKPFIPFAAGAPQPRPRAQAVIDENNCIGCTLCIQACPVDAILGAAKLMHTVIGDECTGCELCVAPCPVDAISMQPLATQQGYPFADRARARFQFRIERLARDQDEKTQRLAQRRAPAAAPAATSNTPPNTLDEQKKAVIAAAMRRAAEKQAMRGTPEGKP